MSEVFREQHPLLCEEASSEEEGSAAAYRRLPHATLRGRASVKAKGAAAIIRTWPDHWMSLLLYLWIVLAMISITIFIVYNSLTFALLKPTASKMISQLRPMISSKLHFFEKSSFSNDIIMPIIVNNYHEVEFNKKFLPYIEIISQQYKEYKYNLLIILNDTSADVKLYDGEINNISSELFESNDIKQHTNNIIIEKTTLSRFMSNSPLNKVWKHLPENYVDFLTRAISIWEKGGISFNPLILTPHSPNPLYIKTLHRYLETHPNFNRKKTHNKVSKKMHPKLTHKINNIRDVIDALENESDSVMQNNLIEAENKMSAFKTDPENKIANSTSKAKIKKPETEIINSKHNLLMDRQMHYDVTVNSSNADLPPPSLLPTFLEFLFRENPRKGDVTGVTSKVVVIENDVKSSPSENLKDGRNIFLTNLENKDVQHARYEPTDVAESQTGSGYDVDEFVLSIDLNGNFIATQTSCHAFLGGMFTDLVHYAEYQTITDFIIKQITIFCKGILSSCKSIDIIII